jgi:transposase
VPGRSRNGPGTSGNTRYHTAAARFYARWFWRATHSRLKPMAQVAWLIRRHLPNVLTYHHHRITNAGLEAVNATYPHESP